LPDSHSRERPAAPAAPPSIVRSTSPRSALALAALVALPLGACSRSDAKAAGTTDVRASRRTGAPVIVPTGYVAGVAGTGRVVGTVAADGGAPADSVVRPTVDADACGAALTPETSPHSPTGLGNVVVWLADIRTGKPIPMEHRFDVAVERCALEPRVQGVLVGGTLDVSSADQLLHTLRFERQESGDSLASVSESENGSVVPIRGPLGSAGLVEIRDPRHSWEHGWVAVFDHPYYAVTGPDGHFSLDDVPVGTYSLHAWHERLGVTVQSVTVGSAETAVGMKLGGKGQGG
jgi:Polysaccharide lyase family 4, domain II